MTGDAYSLPSRRAMLLLGGVAILPLVVWLVFRFAGYTSLLRLGAVALLGLAGAAVVVCRPRLGVYFVVFWIYSGMGRYSPVDAAPVVIAVTLVSVLMSFLREEGNRLTDRGFLYTAALFTLISLQSGFFARDPGLTMFQLLAYAKVLLVIGVVVQLIDTAERLRTLAYVAFGGAVATVFIGIFAIATGLAEGGMSFLGVGLLRFSGAHLDPNDAASIMCSALPLGLFTVRSARGVYRLISVLGVIILIVAIFSTFSRSAIFPFAVLLVGFVVREVRSRRSFYALATLVATGILLTPRFYWDRVFGLGGAIRDATLDWSVYTRLLAAKTSWEMFLHHPLTGVGLGNFIESSSYRLFVRIVAHNTYLEILVGVGIFGLIAFLAMIASGFRHLWAGARHPWRSEHEWMGSLSFYLAFSLVAISVSAVFLTFPFRYQLWIPVAAGLVVGNLHRRETRDPERA